MKERKLYKDVVSTLSTKDSLVIFGVSFAISVLVSLLFSLFHYTISAIVLPLILSIVLDSLLYYKSMKTEIEELKDLVVTKQTLMILPVIGLIVTFLLVFFYFIDKVITLFASLFSILIVYLLFYVLTDKKSYLESLYKRLIEFHNPSEQFKTIEMLKSKVVVFLRSFVLLLTIIGFFKIIQFVLVIKEKGYYIQLIPTSVIIFIIISYIGKMVLELFREREINYDKIYQQYLKDTKKVIEKLYSDSKNTIMPNPYRSLMGFLYANRDRSELFSILYVLISTYGLSNFDLLEKKIKETLPEDLAETWITILGNIDTTETSWRKFIENQYSIISLKETVIDLTFKKVDEFYIYNLVMMLAIPVFFLAIIYGNFDSFINQIAEQLKEIRGGLSFHVEINPKNLMFFNTWLPISFFFFAISVSSMKFLKVKRFEPVLYRAFIIHIIMLFIFYIVSPLVKKFMIGLF